MLRRLGMTMWAEQTMGGLACALHAVATPSPAPSAGPPAPLWSMPLSPCTPGHFQKLCWEFLAQPSPLWAPSFSRLKCHLREPLLDPLSLSHGPVLFYPKVKWNFLFYFFPVNELYFTSSQVKMPLGRVLMAPARASL